MNINATLFVQMFTFLVFVWVTMKFVWPHFMAILDARQAKIAEGIAAGERGRHELALAQNKVTTQLRDAKTQAADIIEQANRRGSQLIEEAKEKAREEGRRLAEVAKADIAQEVQHVKQQLRDQVALIAVSGAEKILSKQIDAAANSELLDQLIAEL